MIIQEMISFIFQTGGGWMESVKRCDYNNRKQIKIRSQR